MSRQGTSRHPLQRGNLTLSAEKAINELGYSPRFSMAEGIALTGEWMRTHGKNQ